MQPVPDPYRLLGVSRGASVDEIKAAHRALAKRYHPDAPGGDTVRFLQVQAAYDVLSNPLRRREWDARNSPGPVRAGQAAASARPRAANGRWTRAEDPPPRPAAGQPRGPSTGQPRGPTAGRDRPPAGAERTASPGRDPSTRTYTWSAGEVPWWEDHGPRDSRRQPGRGRAADERPPRAGPTADRPPADGSGDPGPTERGRAGRPPTPDAPYDFDVYNRSSGAAWSSAARAYFRRAEADLPRRGSFQRQGTQPLTAARARIAAEEEARRAREEARRAQGDARATWDDHSRAAPGERRPAGATGNAAGPRAARSPAAEPKPRSPAGPGAAPPSPAAGASHGPWPRGQTGQAQPAYAWAGVTRDPQSISSARAAARASSGAARWPSLTERLTYALIAWLPVAIAIGYAGSVVTGCDRAAIGCPPGLELMQSALIALALGVLVALPRLAYVAATATAGLVVAAMAIVLGAWFAGVQPPLPLPALAVLGVVLAIVYLATASWALADGPRRRPWAARTRRGFGPGR